LNSRNFIVLEQEATWSQFASEIEAFLCAPPTAIAPAPQLGLQDLTLRERQVLKLVAQGPRQHPHRGEAWDWAKDRPQSRFHRHGKAWT
jgi:hypothetical protein